MTKFKKFLANSLTPFLFVSLWISPKIALASDSCKPVNLYEIPSNPLNSMPIWDQSHLGTCYAYSASQLIDYQLRTHGDPLHGAPISPIWTAFNHKYRANLIQRYITLHDPDGLEYASLKWAIDDLRITGACNEETIKRDLAPFKDRFNITDDELILILSRLWKVRNQTNTTDVNLILKALYQDPDFKDMMTDIDSRLHLHDHHDAFKKFLATLKTKIDAKAKTKSFLSFLKTVIFKNCTPSHVAQVYLPEVNNFGEAYENNEDLTHEIDEALDNIHDPKPVGIGYCAMIYQEETIPASITYRPNPLPRILTMAPKKECSAHYSILVGKRKSKTPSGHDSCDYLLRNSYGTQFWTKKYECYCQESNGQRRNCTYQKDKDIPGIKVLGCWINTNDVNESVFDAVYFKD